MYIYNTANQGQSTQANKTNTVNNFSDTQGYLQVDPVPLFLLSHLVHQLFPMYKTNREQMVVFCYI